MLKCFTKLTVPDVCSGLFLKKLQIIRGNTSCKIMSALMQNKSGFGVYTVPGEFRTGRSRLYKKVIKVNYD